jgi:hypothetical protein
VGKSEAFVKHGLIISIIVYLLVVALLEIAFRDDPSATLNSVFASVPLAVFAILASVKDMCCKNNSYDGEPFIKAFKAVWSLAWTLLAIIFCLRLDGRLNWTWRTVFFPFWIAFAILIIVSVATVSIMLSAIIPLLRCRKKDKAMILTYIWVNMHSVGLCVFLPMLVLAGTSACDDFSTETPSVKYKSVTKILTGLCMYAIVLMLFTLATLFFLR